MTLTAVTLNNWRGKYQSEGCDRLISKDNITVDQNQSLVAGQLVGKVGAQASTWAVVAAAVAGNTGNATIGGISVPAGALAYSGVAVFQLIAISATELELMSPEGRVLGIVKVGTAFVGPIDLLVTAGGTALVPGDSYTLTATPTPAANVGNVVAWNPANTDGSEIAYGIAYDGYTTGAGVTQPGIAHVRECVVWGAYLYYNGANAAQIAAANAQLAQNGLIVR